MADFVRGAAEDKSWRMRYVVAEKLPELAKCLEPKMVVEIFIKFLQDSESEVMVATTGKLAAVCKLMDADCIVSRVIPHLRKISNDSLIHARSIPPLFSRGVGGELAGAGAGAGGGEHEGAHSAAGGQPDTQQFGGDSSGAAEEL